jgi:hypothetical protein
VTLTPSDGKPGSYWVVDDQGIIYSLQRLDPACIPTMDKLVWGTRLAVVGTPHDMNSDGVIPLDVQVLMLVDKDGALIMPAIMVAPSPPVSAQLALVGRVKAPVEQAEWIPQQPTCLQTPPSPPPPPPPSPVSSCACRRYDAAVAARALDMCLHLTYESTASQVPALLCSPHLHLALPAHPLSLPALLQAPRPPPALLTRLGLPTHPHHHLLLAPHVHLPGPLLPQLLVLTLELR